MNITLSNRVKGTSLAAYKKDFSYLAQKTLKTTGRPDAYECSVILVNDEKIHKINREYRGIDRPTDVITFALFDDPDPFDTEVEELGMELGDIFINRDAVIRQSEEYGHSFRREICFLFVHGLLHLLGYDHMTPEDEKKMFAIQHEVLDSYIPFDDENA